MRSETMRYFINAVLPLNRAAVQTFEATAADMHADSLCIWRIFDSTTSACWVRWRCTRCLFLDDYRDRCFTSFVKRSLYDNSKLWTWRYDLVVWNSLVLFRLNVLIHSLQLTVWGLRPTRANRCMLTVESWRVEEYIEKVFFYICSIERVG